MISHRIVGIPCLIKVTEFNVVKPWRGSVHTCPSADDWYGYTDIDFEVCDRRGRPAPWLEKKLSDSAHADIKAAIHDYFKTLD